MQGRRKPLAVLLAAAAGCSALTASPASAGLPTIRLRRPLSSRRGQRPISPAEPVTTNGFRLVGFTSAQEARRVSRTLAALPGSVRPRGTETDPAISVFRQHKSDNRIAAWTVDDGGMGIHLYDELFWAARVPGLRKLVAYTTVHELGHARYDRDAQLRLDWSHHFSAVGQQEYLGWNRYAAHSEGEGFAVGFSMFAVTPRTLARRSPESFRFFAERWRLDDFARLRVGPWSRLAIMTAYRLEHWAWAVSERGIDVRADPTWTRSRLTGEIRRWLARRR